MNKLYIGADPGISGGIAIIDGSSGGLIDAWNTPIIRRLNNKGSYNSTVDSVALLENLLRIEKKSQIHDHVDILVEQVHAMPNQGVSSSFSFGQNYGSLLSALELFAYYSDAPSTISLITPSMWKKHYEITGKGLTTTERKGIAIDKATEIFGDFNRHKYWSRKKDDGVAEAALLARYSYEMDNAHKR